MTKTRLSKTTWRGFVAYRLESSQIALIVVPTLGAKIASMVYKPSGREWLWSNPYSTVKQAQHGDCYTDKFDLGGWDECFPSVAKTTYPESPWEGAAIGDHGEIWSQAWQTELISENGITALKMVATGVSLPYRFERTISIGENEKTVSLKYSVENLSDHDMPFIWSSHPIFAIEPGMKLSFPPQEMTVYSSIGDRFGKLGDKHTWPEITEVGVESNKKYDLSVLPDLDAGYAVKLYGTAPASGEVSLAAPLSGDKLTFSFDTNQITHLGLWLNFNGWSGLGNGTTYYNLGIEPAIGAQDDLALAYKRFGEYGKVQAKQTISWNLDVTLSGEKMNESSEHEDEMCIENEVKEDGRLLTYYHFRTPDAVQESKGAATKDGKDKSANETKQAGAK
jgi:galactose mutarotase-like enzyme